jgi:hypothetical protein
VKTNLHLSSLLLHSITTPSWPDTLAFRHLNMDRTRPASTDSQKIGYEAKDAPSMKRISLQAIRGPSRLHHSRDLQRVQADNDSLSSVDSSDNLTFDEKRRMPHKSRGGTRAFFNRLFVKPYEPAQSYGSVHDMARIGGVSVLLLPGRVSPENIGLTVPTRFAVTADYLAEHGEFETNFELLRAELRNQTQVAIPQDCSAFRARHAP